MASTQKAAPAPPKEAEPARNPSPPKPKSSPVPPTEVEYDYADPFALKRHEIRLAIEAAEDRLNKANREHSDAISARNFAENDIQQIKQRMGRISARAHEALANVADQSRKQMTAAAAEWAQSALRVPSEPPAISPSLAVAWVSTQPEFLVAVRAGIDAAAESPAYGGITSESLADLKKELAEATAARDKLAARIAETAAEVDAAATHRRAVEYGE